MTTVRGQLPGFPSHAALEGAHLAERPLPGAGARRQTHDAELDDAPLVGTGFAHVRGRLRDHIRHACLRVQPGSEEVRRFVHWGERQASHPTGAKGSADRAATEAPGERDALPQRTRCLWQHSCQDAAPGAPALKQCQQTRCGASRQAELGSIDGSCRAASAADRVKPRVGLQPFGKGARGRGGHLEGESAFQTAREAAFQPVVLDARSIARCHPKT